MAIGIKVVDLFALEEISNCFLIVVIPGLHGRAGVGNSSYCIQLPSVVVSAGRPKKRN